MLIGIELSLLMRDWNLEGMKSKTPSAGFIFMMYQI
jgi:hypothetical protein